MNAILAPQTVFDPQLVARHDVAGPRYAVYPPASRFTPDCAEAPFVAAALDSNHHPVPSPLSLYVHLPFCVSHCYHCNDPRVVPYERGRSSHYLAQLQQEIALTARLFDRDRRVLQLRIGGGTPNLLEARQLGTLMACLDRHFLLQRTASAEIAMALDPRSVEPGYLRLLAALGFNQVSIAVPDFDPAVQQAINRPQSREQTENVVAAARAHGLRTVSLELRYGLPRQTPEHLARTLDEVVALDPDRIAIRAYAHRPERFRAQRQIVAHELPNATERLALLDLAVHALAAAGYRYLGMDQFARPDDDLAVAQREGRLHRNLQGYSTHADGDLVGFGIGAISRIGATFSQNAPDLPGYYRALDAGRLPRVRGLVRSDDDFIRNDAIQQVLCSGVVDIVAFEARHGIDFARYFATALAHLRVLQDEGLVRADAQRIAVTPRGRFLLRSIATCFDAYRSDAAIRLRA